MKIKGIILKQEIQKLGLKQEDAAIKLGISRPTLSVWCNKDELTDEIIISVKQKLGLDLTNAISNEDYSPAVLKELLKSFEQKEKLYIKLIEEKDARIKELKERLSFYEDKIKTGTN